MQKTRRSRYEKFLTTRTSDDQLEKLNAAAARKGISRSAFVRRILADALATL